MTALPAQRLLKLLPAIYRIDPDSPADDPFIGRFLLAFEKLLLGFKDDQALLDAKLPASLSGIEETISRIARNFDARKTPKDFLPWLSGWVALSLRADLTEAQQRDFLANTVQRYRTRGTPGSLVSLLKLFTQGTPQIVEEDDRPHHFTINFGLLTQTQYGGEIKDYHTYVDRQTALARAVIELEKPAHTYFTLAPIFPTLRISPVPAVPNAPTPLYYSTVGIDTILGAAIVDPGPPTLSITADRTTIALGDSVTLNWSSTVATQCTASDGWAGSRGLKGSETVTPAAAGTARYSLTAGFGSGITAIGTAEINVLPAGSTLPLPSGRSTTTHVPPPAPETPSPASGLPETAPAAPAPSPVPASQAMPPATSTPAPETSMPSSGTSTSSSGTSTSTSGTSSPASGTSSPMPASQAMPPATSTSVPETSSSSLATSTTVSGASPPASGTSPLTSEPSPTMSETSSPTSTPSTTVPATSTSPTGMSTPMTDTAPTPSGTSTMPSGTTTSTSSASVAPPVSTSPALTPTQAPAGSPAPPAPKVTITSSVSTAAQGEVITLTWASTNATSSSASGAWSGSVATGGSKTLTAAVVGKNSFGITSIGPGGSGSASVVVMITAGVIAPRSPASDF